MFLYNDKPHELMHILSQTSMVNHTLVNRPAYTYHGFRQYKYYCSLMTVDLKKKK